MLLLMSDTRSNGSRTLVGVPAQSELVDILLEGSDLHAASITGSRPSVPTLGLVIVTCMDVRVEPHTVFGIQPGSAHVLRNAGGRVGGDVLRSLAVSSSLMGTTDVVVCHHTDCGLTGRSAAEIESAIQAVSGHRSGIDLRVIDDHEAALWDDCRSVLECEFLPPMTVTGVRYDVHTGRVELVVPPVARPGAAAS